MAGRMLILAYHNVTPPGHESVGERAAHILWKDFVAHLDVLARVAYVVPLSEVGEPPPASASRPRVVLTFDDAYAGAIEFGIPELVRRGFPATVFVPPAFLGGVGFWWDYLADPAIGALRSETRHFVLTELAGRTDLAIEWAKSNGRILAELPDFARACSQQAIESCAGLPGVTLGAHTWSHPNLPRLDDASLAAEFERSWQWSLPFGSRHLPALAFPYGHWNPAVDAAAKAAGFTTTLRVDGGWCASESSDRQPLPRLNVPSGLSAAGLEFRLRGLRS
jgi:peptidoglycan/xylan/chitin deacetylase (PgdA/CDA1 family)